MPKPVPEYADPGAGLAAIEAAYQQSRYAEAESACSLFLREHPNSIEAKFLLARIQAKSGRIQPALSVIEEVRAGRPDWTEPLRWQGALLRELGRFGEAAHAYERILEVSPQDIAAIRSLGICLLADSRWAEADSAFRRELGLEPASVSALHNLGFVLTQRKSYEEAVLLLKRAIVLSPGAARTWMCLGQALRLSGRYEEACEAFGRAAQLEPDNAEIQVYWARALGAPEEAREAETHLRQAIRLNPSLGVAHSLLGMKLRDLGQFDEAKVCFERSIELEPRQGVAYLGIARSRKLTDADGPLIETMEAIGADQSVDSEEMRYLRFALGKAYADLGRYELAMNSFNIANEIGARERNAQAVIDRALTVQETDSKIRLFTKEYFENLRALGSSSELPVLIVGMWRSGTTLLEQILSSHPLIGAGEELTYWAKCWQEHGEELESGLAPTVARRLEHRYLSLLQGLAPSALRVTDKDPLNYLRLGMVHLCFPNARIIHSRREPIDNCLSLYMTPMNVDNSIVHLPRDIMFIYREYMRLMEHWRQVLPPERFMEVDYEEIVSDREPVVRKLVEFLGLEWDDACLEHDKNTRSVTTPSNWQVRQPIYKSSAQVWRKYEPWLGEFRELVGVHHPGIRWRADEPA